MSRRLGLLREETGCLPVYKYTAALQLKIVYESNGLTENLLSQ